MSQGKGSENRARRLGIESLVGRVVRTTLESPSDTPREIGGRDEIASEILKAQMKVSVQAQQALACRRLDQKTLDKDFRF